jgi:hypothetical protein
MMALDDRNLVLAILIVLPLLIIVATIALTGWVSRRQRNLKRRV